mgnify:CR=1 FL=1
MQSLGLDVQVQREDGTEVEMTESIDYGDTELRAMLEGDRHYNDRESYSNYGYQEQEFKLQYRLFHNYLPDPAVHKIL